MALASIGEYKKAEEAHLKSLQLDRSFVEAWAHLTQVTLSDYCVLSTECLSGHSFALKVYSIKLL